MNQKSASCQPSARILAEHLNEAIEQLISSHAENGDWPSLYSVSQVAGPSSHRPEVAEQVNASKFGKVVAMVLMSASSQTGIAVVNETLHAVLEGR